VLQDAVRKIPPGAGTSIYDAIVLGSRSLAAQKSDRRHVIILVTDGGETTSHAEFETARKAAVRSDTLLYTILIRAMKNEGGRNTAGEHALQTITETTGAPCSFPTPSPNLASFSIKSIASFARNTALPITPIREAPLIRFEHRHQRPRRHKVRHRKNYYTAASSLATLG